MRVTDQLQTRNRESRQTSCQSRSGLKHSERSTRACSMGLSARFELSFTCMCLCEQYPLIFVDNKRQICQCEPKFVLNYQVTFILMTRHGTLLNISRKSELAISWWWWGVQLHYIRGNRLVGYRRDVSSGR